ncbi:MAG TPA: SUF system NifU family Fe-S cluster assembly protein [Chloroflexota bacterium]|jgi:nitrogen fixation NifU-like protein|nr:SUF system NifU family Fe-S cluster assembly protein [Chloroflexota bacterium]
MSSDLYQEQILDHYRHPRNYGSLEHPDATFADSNPLCGDMVAVDLIYEGDQVAEVRFRGSGCAISQASTSMLTEMVEGRTKEEARAIPREALLEELGVPLSPARVKCALLGYKVMMGALYGLPPRLEE